MREEGRRHSGLYRDKRRKRVRKFGRRLGRVLDRIAGGVLRASPPPFFFRRPAAAAGRAAFTVFHDCVGEQTVDVGCTYHNAGVPGPVSATTVRTTAAFFTAATLSTPCSPNSRIQS